MYVCITCVTGCRIYNHVGNIYPRYLFIKQI